MSSKPVLVYVRPWNVEQFREIAAHAFPEADLVLCSEHREVDDVGLSSAYVDALRQTHTGEVPSDLGANVAYDMIARCRLLRALPAEAAEQHLNAMHRAITGHVDRINPQAVLGLTVDSFVLDLIRYAADERGIPFIGLVPTFINGYFRVTARGEGKAIRAPAEAEVEQVLQDVMRETYRPAFLSPVAHQKSHLLLRQWVDGWMRAAYFTLIRLWPGRRFNYHYWSSQVVALQHLQVRPHPVVWERRWVERVKHEAKPLLYLPLQMIPECTVDYWCSELEAVSYYKSLTRYIDAWGATFTFVIKEHPAVMGRRPAGFYEALSDRADVLLVPPETPSNEVLSRCDATMVWTGTPGFEAALRGEPVLTVGDPYYQAGLRFMSVDHDTTAAEVLRHIECLKAIPQSSAERKELLANLLSLLLPGHFRNDGTWMRANSTCHGEAVRMGKAIRRYEHLLSRSKE